MFSLFLPVLLSALSIGASPLKPRQTITALTTTQIEFFRPYTHFASTAYCQPSTTITWTCGFNCEANPDFVPVASGGDGGSIQFWYVGFSPSLNSVVVGHQGTNFSQIQADLTDLDIIMEKLNPTLFPGIDSSVKVHSGFANEQAKTATQVLSAVQTTISKFGARQVALVGHSLGAAIALLDSIYLPLHISGVSFTTVGYGMPRVGNQAFANYVDTNLHLTHIDNRKDPVPTLPGLFMGYHHPSGEVHITETGPWENCPGQDNPSTLCIVGDVPNILASNPPDHIGPYDGISMGC
ncbi:hypothetical protein AX17_007546 [Amanita inopinata Kibby_2008]|nr:hypothetical protein AX17_007546 [Amanita inopinata Kibby_2008]